MRPLSCVCVRSAAPVSSSSRVLSHTRKRTFHVKHPTFAAYPRRSRALPRLRALAPALRASRSCASLASRPGLRILAPRPHPPPLARTPRARAPRGRSAPPAGPGARGRTPPAPRASLVLRPAPRGTPAPSASPRVPCPGILAPGFCIRAVRRLPRRSLSLRFRCQDSLNLSDIN